MSNHAIDSLNDAFARTKSFFFEPFSIKRWLKIGMVGFLGGIAQQAGGSNCNSSSGGNSSGGSSSPVDSDIGEKMKHAVEKIETLYHEHTTLIFLLGGLFLLLIVALSLLFQYIRANMFFVFIESLAQKEVTVMKSFGNNKGNAFSLFIFRAILGFVSLVIIIVASIPLILYLWKMAHASNPNWDVWAIIANSLLSVITFIVVCIIMHCIMSPTHDFAAAISYGKNMGILGGWVYLLNLIKANPLQFFLYYVVKIALAIVIGIGMLIIFLVLLLPLIILYIVIVIGFAIILIPVALVIYFLFTVSPILGGIACLLLGLIFFALIMVIGYVTLLPFIPIHTFFRYYPLCFLEKIDGTLNFREAFLKD